MSTFHILSLPSESRLRKELKDKKLITDGRIVKKENCNITVLIF